MKITSTSRAVIYARVSQDRSNARSVKEQQAECQSWADREGWQVDAVYVDNDISASRYAKKQRPAWQALTDDLAEGKFDLLLVWEPSRATRDRRVWGTLAAICETQAVRIGVSGRLYDLEDPDDAFQLDLFFALATRESGATRKRVLRAVHANAAAGRPHGRKLYGYRREYAAGTATGVVLTEQVVEELQGPIVREVARRVLDGQSCYAIAMDLNKREVRGPTGMPWAAHQIKRMCINPGYTGARVHRGVVVVRDCWPALISAEDHERLVVRLTDPARRTSLNREVQHLVSGLARCGECGGRMNVIKNRGNPSYFCREYAHVSRKETDVDKVVTTAVIGFLQRPDPLSHLSASTSDDRHEYRVQAAALRDRLAGFYAEAAAGNLTPVGLAAIEGRLLPAIADLEKRGRPVFKSALVARALEGDAAAVWDGCTLAQRREMIDLLCTVTIDKAGAGNRVFDPSLVRVEWKSL